MIAVGTCGGGLSWRTTRKTATAQLLLLMRRPRPRQEQQWRVSSARFFSTPGSMSLPFSTAATNSQRQEEEEKVKVQVDDVDVTSRLWSRCKCDLDTGIVSIVGDEDNTRVVEFQTVIGVEIHAQLAVPRKLFSLAPAAAGVVAPFDAAFPGALPTLPSPGAVQAAVLSAHALHCHIHTTSRFERKHYHYPDLPCGYQITQQQWPIATHGYLYCRKQLDSRHLQRQVDRATVATPPLQAAKTRKRGNRSAPSSSSSRRQDTKDPSTGSMDSKDTTPNNNNDKDDDKFFVVQIDRIQLEQDSGKTSGNGQWVNLHRAGCALLEIVFQPQVRSAHQAASLVETLQQLLRSLETCQGRMERGQLRCDLNVSIAPRREAEEAPSKVVAEAPPRETRDAPHHSAFGSFLPPGTGQRVEIKNLNSIRQVVDAAEYEAKRQALAHDWHKAPTERETRTFDVATGQTRRIRSKVNAMDYRFLPDPDLPPLILNRQTLGGHDTVESFLGENMPELPEEATARLVRDYGIPEDVARVLTLHKSTTVFYQEAVQAAMTDLQSVAKEVVAKEVVAKSVANWLINDLSALLLHSDDDDLPREEEEDGTTEPAAKLQQSPVSGAQLGALVATLLEGTVSTTMARKILTHWFRGKDRDAHPRDVARAHGWVLIRDWHQLQTVCRSVVWDPAHAPQRQHYRQGGKFVRKMEKFFSGKVMAACRGNAHPELMQQALQDVLSDMTNDE